MCNSLKLIKAVQRTFDNAYGKGVLVAKSCPGDDSLVSVAFDDASRVEFSNADLLLNLNAGTLKEFVRRILWETLNSLSTA